MGLRTTALGFVGAAAVLGAGAPAQEPRLLPDDALGGLGEQIEAIQSSQGINAPELIGPLTSLGLLMREQEDRDLAAAAFERARHVVRVNYGFDSFEEAPLLRQLVLIEEEKGNAAGAWDLEQRLLGLIYRYPGPRAAPLLKEIADKRAAVLRRYFAGEIPPQIVLGCYYAPPSRDPPSRTAATARRRSDTAGCPRSGSANRVKAALRNETRYYYEDVIAMVLESEGPSADELPDIYLDLARALYAYPNERFTGYEGSEVLREIHSLSVRNGEPLEAQLNALLRIADWDLRFARGRKENEAAFAAYESLYDRLRQEGLDRSQIDGIFSPSVPVVLPAFVSNPLASTETSRSAGYIDVAFEITKYGEGRSVSFLDTSSNLSDEARSRVREIIMWSRFRPRMANGVFEDPARVVVRYYLNDRRPF